MPVARISEHTNRPEFIDLLKRLLGVNYRVFQELLIEDRDQEDIVIFFSDKIRVLDNQNVEWSPNQGAVAVIETKKHDIENLEVYREDLIRYLNNFNSKLGFITNYSKVIVYRLNNGDNLEVIDMLSSPDLKVIITFIVNKIHDKTKLAIYREPHQIMKLLEEYINSLIRYTSKITPEKWEEILKLSDLKIRGNYKSIDLANLSNEQKKEIDERNKLIWRSAAYIAVAQIFFYIVFRLYRIQNQINVTPELIPLSSSNGVPSNIQEILEAIPDNSLNFKSILGKDKIIFSFLNDDSSEILYNIIKSLEGVSVNFVIENDLIGQIFQRCLPSEIRKKYAAYYTKMNASRLLCRLSIEDKDMLVFDPACGSGTLLVSSYHRKKTLGLNNHKKLLDQIKGGDISTMATMMSTVNLAIQDPSKWTNEVKLYNRDSFELLWGIGSYDSKEETHSANGVSQKDVRDKDKKIEKLGDRIKEISRDLIIANPPFTFGIRLSDDDRNYLVSQVEQRFKLRLDFGRVGLYAPFLLLAVDLQSESDEGRISYVLPLSSIHSPSMTEIWETILKKGYGIKYLILASNQDISFSDSDSHEVMILLEKGYQENATFISLNISLEDIDIEELANLIEDKARSDYFSFIEYTQEFLRTTPCHQWSFESDLTLELLINSFKEFKHFDDIVVIPEHQYKPVDFWLIPNKYWEISAFQENHIELIATERNIVVQKKENKIPVKIKLPMVNLRPILSNLLEDFNNIPIIIPSNIGELQKSTFIKFFIIAQKTQAYKLYFKWGKIAQEEKLFGKTWSSGRISENVEIGIIRQINYNNSKTLAMRVKYPIPLSRVFIFGMRFKNSRFADLFFSYLTSSLFCYYAVNKSRKRSGSYVKIEKADFLELYRFPDFKVLLEDDETTSKLIDLSEAFNSSMTLAERPKIYEQIENAKKDIEYGLRKLDEAWFDALSLHRASLGSFYKLLLEKIYILF